MQAPPVPNAMSTPMQQATMNAPIKGRGVSCGKNEHDLITLPTAIPQLVSTPLQSLIVDGSTCTLASPSPRGVEAWESDLPFRLSTVLPPCSPLQENELSFILEGRVSNPTQKRGTKRSNNTTHDEHTIAKKRRVCGMKTAMKNAKGMSGTGTATDNVGASGGNDLANVSEEELKRIRRVKNRESVEKCRTKQRLRMEALQVEQTCLMGENNCLRQTVGKVEGDLQRLKESALHLHWLPSHVKARLLQLDVSTTGPT